MTEEEVNLPCGHSLLNIIIPGFAVSKLDSACEINFLFQILKLVIFLHYENVETFWMIYHKDFICPFTNPDFDNMFNIYICLNLLQKYLNELPMLIL